MFVKILGYFWIGMGLLFVIKPQILKNMMQKKTLRKLRKYFILLALILGGFLISLGFKFQGLLAKILMVFGIIGVFKVIFLANEKLTEKILSWWGSKPIIYFRLGACFYIGIGIAILMLR